jgi:hypothetical protein
MIDCADYLTSTEIQTLQQMHDAAAFFTCTCAPDTLIKLFTNPGVEDPKSVFTYLDQCIKRITE